eukprot:gene650-693_t
MSFHMMPDQVMTPLLSQVRVRQGSLGSVVLLKALIKGVKILNARSLEEDRSLCEEMSEKDHQSSMHERNSCANCDLSDESSSPFRSSLSSSIIDQSNDRNKGRNYLFSIAAIPIETVAEVLFVLLLDEKHFIQQIRLEYKCILEAPIQLSND